MAEPIISDPRSKGVFDFWMKGKFYKKEAMLLT
jgi:hypothetical protein